MRRSFSIRIATVILVASMAAPVFAAPRDDSPFDSMERAISRIVKQIIHKILPADLPVLTNPK